MTSVLERAVERLRADEFYVHLEEAYEELGKDPAASAEEAGERAAWEATLADGLDSDDDNDDHIDIDIDIDK